jgi:hypothetical protein
VFGRDLLIPERGLLLHIGPHKTGTTAIQGALRQARPALADHGVIYAGTVRQHQMAALALTGGRGMKGARPARAKDWEQLVEQVHAAAQQRVIVSSEFFDEADDLMARRAVDELGGERVHVVVTLRPLAKILPSAWQQYVRNGVSVPYHSWLDGMLTKAPYDRPTPSFWRRHRHAELVERWASIVGPERILVVVVDESDRDALMRTFEQIVGLPRGVLAPESGWTNRSFTAAETELVRDVNIRFRGRKWPEPVYNRVIRLGAVASMQRRTPAPDEPGIATPKWAIDRANELAAEASARISASGVRVLGDLASLSSVEPKDDDVSIDEVSLPVPAASAAVLGAIAASGVIDPETPAARAPRDISHYSSRELVGILGKRVRDRAERRRRSRRKNR